MSAQVVPFTGEAYPDDTETWCGFHAVGRSSCKCLYGSSPAPGRAIRALVGSSIRPEVTRWAITHRVPMADLTLVSGREGLGKSLVTVSWAADATRGRLDGIPEPSPVGFVIGEDHLAKTVVPRLMVAGADMDRVMFLKVEDTGLDAGSPMFPIDSERVADFVTDHGIRFLVLDPLVGSLDHRLDSHKDHSIRQALDPLNRVAHRTGAAIVGIVHEGKGGGDLANRVLGSRAFVAAARSVVSVVRDPEDESTRLVVQTKSNLGPLDLPALTFTVDSASVETDTVAASVGRLAWGAEKAVDLADLTSADSGDHDERDALVGFITHYLVGEGGEAPARDVQRAVADAFGPTAKATLHRARKRAGVITDKAGMSAGWVWRLSEDFAEGTEGSQSQTPEPLEPSRD